MAGNIPLSERVRSLAIAADAPVPLESALRDIATDVELLERQLSALTGQVADLRGLIDQHLQDCPVVEPPVARPHVQGLWAPA